jgi:hypothetical protein
VHAERHPPNHRCRIQVDVPEEALLSRGVFDGVEGDFVGLCRRWAGCGARESRRRRLLRALAGVGGAVRAGPLGPPVWGSLEGPGVELSPAIVGSDRPCGRSCSPGLAGHSGPHHCRSGTDQRPPWFGARTYLRSALRHMVCFRPQSRRAHSVTTATPAEAGSHVDTRTGVPAVPEPSQLASFWARQQISPSLSP